MKSLKTGAEYRHGNKLRVEKFKKEMAEKGYKNVTVFMSQELREELEQLKEDKGLNRQKALEYIFEIYKKAITSNNTGNITNKSLFPPEDMQDYREWLVNKIRGLKEDDKLTSAQIAEILNKQGLKSMSGKPWSRDSVTSFWKRRKK